MKILARAAWHKSGTGFSGQLLMPGATPRRMKILARAAWHKSGTGFSGQGQGD
jgi:deoxyribose-phosphate aldolase